MVVRISSCYENSILKRSSLHDDEFDFFERLINLMREKKLFFRASLKLYSFLLNKYKDELTSKNKALLNRLIYDGFVSLTEADSVSPLFVVYGAKKRTICKNGSFHLSYKNMPLNYEPLLASEDPTDAEFYLYLYNKCPFKKNIFIETDGAGGSRVRTYLTNWFKSKRIVLYIGDSDKNYPCKAKYGKTSQHVIDYFKVNNPEFGQYYILSVHEKENLLPFSVYPLDANKKQVIEYVSLLGDDYLNHFDIKSGIKKTLVSRKEKKFDDWHYFYDPVIEYINENGYVESDLSSEYLWEGIGSNAVMNYIKSAKNIKSVIKKMTVIQKNDLIRISSLIDSFGYAYDKVTS